MHVHRLAVCARLLVSVACQASSVASLPGSSLAAPAAASRSALSGLSTCPQILNPSYSNNTLAVARGWAAQLVVQGLQAPRSLRFDSRGALLVLEAGAGVRHFVFDDYGGTCLVVRTSHLLVNSTDLNHGLGLSSDGTRLYASSANDVLVWTYDARAARVSSSTDAPAAAQTLVTGMASGGHTTCTLLLARAPPADASSPGTRTDLLLVARGSSQNVDPAAADASSGSAQIRAFVVDAAAPDDARTAGPALTPAARTYVSGTLVAWGLRNAVGLAEEPITHTLYSVENSADNAVRAGVDIHENNPGEELNAHSYMSDIAAATATNTTDPLPPPPIGANYGYPFCFSLWDPAHFPDRGNRTVGDQFALEPRIDPLCSSGGADNDGLVPPRLTFQAHMAPLDLVFAADGAAAYVSFHGSWDRASPVGYKVAAVPFAGGTPVAAANSTSAAQDLFWNTNLAGCPGQCFRPAGLALDAQGRLFVSSDSTGEIYVLRQVEA